MFIGNITECPAVGDILSMDALGRTSYYLIKRIFNNRQVLLCRLLSMEQMKCLSTDGKGMLSSQFPLCCIVFSCPH